MKILILCAGIGSRLGKLTEDNPKCLVKINSESILERLLNQLSKFGLNEKDIYFCGGYKYEKLPSQYLSFINHDYLITNMLKTTIIGLEGLVDILDSKQNILIIYGDCIYSDKFISEIISKTDFVEQISIPVDLDWERKWSRRYDNIYEDAETLEYNLTNNELISIGKKTFIKKEYMAQFMGIYVIPHYLIRNFISEFNLISPYIQNKISTTEFFQISNGKLKYYVLQVNNSWTEVDTVKDLIYAKENFL